MELAWTRAVALILAIWWLASAVHQLLLSWWWCIERHDTLGLLPRWSFFAPSPGRYDLHLVYREEVDGCWSAWQPLPSRPADRRWRWLWNPERFSRKALADFANGLRQAKHSTPEIPRVVLLSTAYLSLLACVMAQPGGAPSAGSALEAPASVGATQRQFAVVNTQGFDAGRPLDVLFVSEVHRAAI